MTTWILLRGLMREARHWGDFPQYFAAQMARDKAPIQLITPDFAGNGSLCAHASASKVTDMVQQLRTQLRTQGHAPPYHVLALSLGAMAAVAWADSAPQELSRVVLINTSLQPYNRFYERLRPQNYPRLLAMLAQGSLAQRERTILQITSNLSSAAQRQHLQQQWQAFAEQHPVTRKNILRQLLAAMRYRAPNLSPAVPLLMLAAQGDQLVHVRCSEKIAAHWGCPLALHPTAGHDLPLDDAPWVVQQVQAWMQRQNK